MRRIVALIALSLIGCTDGGPVPLPRRLEIAEQRWRSWGSANYDYVYDISCFCVVTGPRLLEVRNGVVTRTIDPQSGAVDQKLYTTLTVDSLFALLHGALTRGEHTEATFDARGMPSSMVIGTLENDAGYRIRATSFVKR